MSGNPRLLFVDDDVPVQRAFVRSLQGTNVVVDCVNGVLDALAAMRKGGYDVVATDMTMPDGNGLDVLAGCDTLLPRAGRMVISGDPDLAGALVDTRVDAVLTKPWDMSDLRREVERVLALALSRASAS